MFPGVQAKGVCASVVDYQNITDIDFRKVNPAGKEVPLKTEWSCDVVTAVRVVGVHLKDSSLVGN